MTLKVLIVDDESLARSRLRTLLADCKEPEADVVGEAANAVQAMDQLQHGPCDLVLLDIHMPGVGGMALAGALMQMPQPPAVVFVTAHTEYAVQAFEIEAVDYLTKPVRLERLQLALQKVVRQMAVSGGENTEAAGAGEALIIQERGRSERVALAEVIYLKAELKYITVRTANKEHIYDGSLSDLEQKYAQLFVRVHRNALVARRRVRAVEKHNDPVEGEGWTVRLDGVDERLAVSRRQLAAVREALAG
ncbi:LytR/AlgR family response regulator transcription factor [Hydrogenophaga sp.]|uniref:LytR/AlgR family response regulator transcription factor n=1 Tax=Hydrogenophaga sp. TaxID=1904254 RepID=UPI003564E3EE